MAQIEKKGTRLIVRGAMTMENVKELLIESRSYFSSGQLEIDLAAVDEVDSSAISLLFEWLRQARAGNVNLVFASLPANLTSLATLYGVLELIPQHTH